MPVPALPITRNLKRKSEQMVPRIKGEKDTGNKRKNRKKKKTTPKQKQPYIMNSKTLL